MTETNHRCESKDLTSASTLPSITITINGAVVVTPHGSTILDAADRAGVAIPRLCAFPGLSSFERCRLCVVEVDGMRGFPTACSTQVLEGMVVRTDTEELRRIRQTSLELILSEHPTGCLLCGYQTACAEHHVCGRRSGTVTGCRFCPKDRQCELQRVVEEIGLDEISFPVRYRGLPVVRRDPFIERDDNLCILCARCVRVCDEVRGSGAIAMTSRGSSTMVGTGYNRPLADVGCQFCGSCIDVCPTGSLIEKAFKWEGSPDRDATLTCPFCSLGCEIVADVRRGKVVRSRPTSYGLTNGEICVRGRFCITGLANHPDRIESPLVRTGGRLLRASWDAALDLVAQKIGNAQPGRLSLHVSRDVTNEDLSVAQQFAQYVMKSDRIAADGWPLPDLVPLSTARLQDIAGAATILTVSTDMRYSHTAARSALVRGVRGSATHIGIEPSNSDLKHYSGLWLTPKPGTEALVVLSVLRLVAEGQGNQSRAASRRLAGGLRSAVGAYDPVTCGALAGVSSDDIVKVARRIVDSPPTVSLWGSRLFASASARACIRALETVASLSGGTVMPLLEGMNPGGPYSLGIASRDIGRLPSDPFILSIGQPPWRALPNDAFLVVHDLFAPPEIPADVVLPATAFTEEDGTITDSSGKIRSVKRAVEPFGESRPAWWVLGEIARRLGTAGLCYRTSEDIRPVIAHPPSSDSAPHGDDWVSLIPESPSTIAAQASSGEAERASLAGYYGRFTYRNNRVDGLVPSLATILGHAAESGGL